MILVLSYTKLHKFKYKNHHEQRKGRSSLGKWRIAAKYWIRNNRMWQDDIFPPTKIKKNYRPNTDVLVFAQNVTILLSIVRVSYIVWYRKFKCKLRWKKNRNNGTENGIGYREQCWSILITIIAFMFKYFDVTG